jgi:hypothetical protein
MKERLEFEARIMAVVTNEVILAGHLAELETEFSLNNSELYEEANAYEVRMSLPDFGD